MATPRLQREVDLLFAMRLIEPNGSCPYRLTTAGATVLEIDKRRRIGAADAEPR